ncbi:MAG: sodium-translocating pyrophosphatase [Chloroflexi bacterium]|jgi:K(+)-stimulated pyrophosphate-energized sodium pump|nr:sodium-translocating pyrophosphatase [Dehalococcoidia bacterium]PKB82730.1 MAG: sodium-translocating pyrophosphatase [SAR202 cluster bacterium MP-SInd-SRR3963457-G1]PKB85831.1 MAG: sodium-translocating pyrophosphatase [SAR202 cluster bacterium MP-NPac-SRR3961935-G1]RUA21579.1 MAG: sodium-translocating pyrophosphatase [Chloroflexota bacterium]RUA33022.1 MAG: sodium-translocating pyrophosphatase [Chloroflexota bacterium]
MESIIVALAAGCVALLFAAFTAIRVLRADPGNQRMRAIGDSIRDGASTFLRREYMVLAPFVIVVAAGLWVLIDWWTLGNTVPETAIAYLAGTICSATAGFIGMSVAVRANVRTAAAAMHGLNPALRIAFSSGTVMGITVVGIGLLGVTILYVIFQDITVVAGFGFGASSIALFARVGGGIFTKAADVGSDLVGKIEAGIPEDDPRNPGVIADNVGDNVGDVAGMGADLFESYVSSIIAAIALATVGTAGAIVGWDDDKAVLPLMLAGAGIVAAILGTFVVRSSEQANFGQLLWALRRGIFASAILLAVFALVVVLALDMDIKWFWAIITGLTAGIIIGLSTEYYTSYDYKPTQQIAESSQTGAATVMISGIATGMISTVVPLVAVAFTIIIAFELSGFYGVALAGVGLLSTLGITLATDAYGPVADNAGGIAEQAQLDPEVRERTDALDALGNTTAATGKGFAIGSAALTSLALLAAFAIAADIKTINLLEHTTIVGILFGAMLPFLFSAFTMKAVGRAAMDIVAEVRRQFREIPGLLEGTAEPDYNECVDIATKGALKEMIVPGLMAVAAPLATGFVLGVEALGGMLIGAVGSGFMLAIMMATAGGAWDNAKKYVELGHYGGKGSDAHKAAVEGDVVGDPFKDTSGPSLNILLKLMAIVSLVFAPVFLEVTPLIDVIT